MIEPNGKEIGRQIHRKTGVPSGFVQILGAVTLIVGGIVDQNLHWPMCIARKLKCLMQRCAIRNVARQIQGAGPVTISDSVTKRCRIRTLHKGDFGPLSDKRLGQGRADPRTSAGDKDRATLQIGIVGVGHRKSPLDGVNSPLLLTLSAKDASRNFAYFLINPAGVSADSAHWPQC